MYFVKFGISKPVSHVDIICESSYFPYTAEVRPDWAPHGTLRFLELAAAGANLNVIVVHLYKLNLTCTCKCNLNNLISLSFHVHVSMILLEQVTLMTVHFIVLCLVASWQQVSSWRCLLSPKRCGCDLFFSLDLCMVAKTKLLLMLVCGNDIKRKMTLFEIILQPATK